MEERREEAVAKTQVGGGDNEPEEEQEDDDDGDEEGDEDDKVCDCDAAAAVPCRCRSAMKLFFEGADNMGKPLGRRSARLRSNVTCTAAANHRRLRVSTQEGVGGGGRGEG